MRETSNIRRRSLLLAAAAAPVAAVGKWMSGARHEQPAGTMQAYRFYSAPEGIRWSSPQGSDGLLLALGVNFALLPGGLSPDGRHLVYSTLDRRTGSNIWTVPITQQDDRPAAGLPAPFHHDGAFNREPRFSADGRQIAYASCLAGRWSVQVHAFDWGPASGAESIAA